MGFLLRFYVVLGFYMFFEFLYDCCDEPVNERTLGTMGDLVSNKPDVIHCKDRKNL